MKGSLIFLFGFFLSSQLYAEVFQFPRPRGINTDDHELFLRDGQTPDAENVVTDEVEGAIIPRGGYTSFSTETSKKLWVFPHSSGVTYLITISSNQLKATTGVSNFTIGISTIDVNNLPAGSALGDRFYFIDKTNGLKYWDTSSTVASSPTLKADKIVTHKGRLWLAGVTGDQRTIYGSEYLVGTNFNLVVNPTDTDPVRVQVQGSLDQVITALYATFNDLLIWLKNNSFGGIYGSRRSNFTSRSFSETVGTSGPDSIQNCDGKLRWIGTDKKVWEFDGANYKPLTDDIDTYMASLVNTGLSQKSITQTAQEDWGAGANIGANLSTTSSPGDLVFTSLASPADDFEDGDFTSNPAWYDITYTYASPVVTSGRLEWGALNDGVQMFVPSEVVVATWTFNTQDLRRYKQLNISFIENNLVNGYRMNISDDGNNTSYDFNLQRMSPATTICSSTTIRDADQRITINRTASGAFKVYRGANNVEICSVTDNTYQTSTRLRLVANNQNSGDYILDSIAMTFPNDIKSSSFTSQVLSVGNSITAWGPLTANYSLSGGSITFGIYSDTNSSINIWDSTTYISSQIISSGQTPYITTAAFVTVTSSFSRTSSTFTPTLNDFTLVYQDTVALVSPSLWYNRRYYMGVSVSSTSNNRVLVYDRNLDWHRYSGVNTDAMVMYKGSPLFGNQYGIWNFDIGHNDNGSNIAAYYKTKDYTLGALNYRKMLDNLYMTTSNSDATLQTQYYIDGVNSAFSFSNYAMNSESGLQDVLFPFPFNSLQQAKTFALKWTVSSNTDWAILNADLFYQVDPEHSD